MAADCGKEGSFLPHPYLNRHLAGKKVQQHNERPCNKTNAAKQGEVVDSLDSEENGRYRLALIKTFHASVSQLAIIT